MFAYVCACVGMCVFAYVCACVNLAIARWNLVLLQRELAI